MTVFYLACPQILRLSYRYKIHWFPPLVSASAQSQARECGLAGHGVRWSCTRRRLYMPDALLPTCAKHAAKINLKNIKCT